MKAAIVILFGWMIMMFPQALRLAGASGEDGEDHSDHSHDEPCSDFNVTDKTTCEAWCADDEAHWTYCE